MSRELSDVVTIKSGVPANLPVTKVDKSNQIVYGVVYEPFAIDTDGETISKEHVAKMAWDFIASGYYTKIDIQHNFKESGSTVVESFVTRKGDPDFPEDSWVLGVQVPDEVWELVLSGDLNGFSLAGPASKTPAKVVTEIEKQIVGKTESSTIDILPSHEHTFIVNYNKDGKVVSGKTDTVLDHFHTIRAETATEKGMDHSHRFEV
jgi:hypothetical protein